MGYGENTSAELERVVTIAMDAAFKVHRELGPGLLESIYEVCLVYELRKRGLKAERQIILPVTYDGVVLDTGLRIDVLVEDILIFENKSVEKMNPVYDAQLLTYLKLTKLRLGLLINWNVQLLKDGIKRIIR